tara:strand:- start:100 stop:612 length:513 start_codon:yes stop_codon:yes gene_type:complete
MLDDIVNSNLYLLTPAFIHLFYKENFIALCYSSLLFIKLFKGYIFDISSLIIGFIIFAASLWSHLDFTWWSATFIITYLMMEWSFYIDHIKPKYRKDQDNKWWGVLWIFMIINPSIKMRPYKTHSLSFIKGLFWGVIGTLFWYFTPKIRNSWIEHMHLTPFKKDIKEINS